MVDFILEGKNTKICSKCGESKELRFFSFRVDTNKYRGQCRKCHKGYDVCREERKDIVNKLLTDNKKECSKCNKIKSLSDFTKDSYTYTKYSSNCKECINTNNKDNAASRKKTTAKRRYNITDDQYDELMAVETCVICSEKLTDDNRHIDHCHTTQVVRGALCSFCNMGLGHFKDNIESLTKAIKYLNNK